MSDAILFGVDGSVTPVEINTPMRDFDEVCRLIGADMIELVYLGSKVMLIDENGKIHEKPRNSIATMTARSALFPGDYIAGPALLIDAKDMAEDDV